MKNILLVVGLSTVLIGCGSGAPECSDTETKDLVKQIASEEMAEQIGAEAANQFTYKVNAIRTTDKNEKTGSKECAAQLEVIAANGGSNELPIEYTVEVTDDQKEFFVTVYGL
ncbi:hypothetical protein [Vibrio diazotrophicus]|uniref:hypothetical protein n=1 Tax=Vibrio diazotrophicus TaxID=685 RepID=UPI000C9EB890|nr:hypothetical protein [Vibrio diazotrophicus]PNH88133.1 hypothetical protein C1M59_20430 [Vibrio diazotrophicus]